MQDLNAELLARRPLPRHDGGGDKEDRGRVLIVGGCAEVAGAALLAGLGALRAGAGKLQMATAPEAAVPLAVAAPEARVFAYDPARVAEAVARCDAAAVGPGLLDQAQARRLAEAAMEADGEAPVLLDAAALPAARPRRRPMVLTPHAGEMAQLLSIAKEEVEAAPADIARDAAIRFGAVVALKGAATYIASPEGELIRHQDGVFGLATSGSGDVLAGIMAGLLARGAEPLTACIWGVFLHGQAGARLTRRLGPLGFLAREILGEIPGVLAAHSSLARQ